MSNIEQPNAKQEQRVLKVVGLPEVDVKVFLQKYKFEATSFVQPAEDGLQTALLTAKFFFSEPIKAEMQGTFRAGLYKLAWFMFQQAYPLSMVEKSQGDEYVEVADQQKTRKASLTGVLLDWQLVNGFNERIFKQRYFGKNHCKAL